MANAKKTKKKTKTKTKAKIKTKAKARPKPKSKPKAKAKTKAKTKSARANGPPPINQPICGDIAQAVMGQQVIFTGVTGTCTISQGNTEWPFNWGPDIRLPNPGNPAILIARGLNTVPPNNVYQYVCSCCPQDSQTHTVTVTG